MSLTPVTAARDELAILYRGPLSSCNYDCHYCPFAKTRDSRAELETDRRALERFVDRIAEFEHRRVSVFFTPWGEALIRRWYRTAMIRLSRMPHVAKVAVQTNLSAPVGWLADADPACVGLWCTWHPSQIERERFVRKSLKLTRIGIRHSVGMVGLKEDFDAIEQLRAELPAETYLWINAYKREPDYYSEAEIRRLEAIDPHFRTNTIRHPSLGRRCLAGESVITVDGEGTVRRCHFIAEPIGNIYADDFERCLRPRRCTNATCGCHIGYIHMPELGLADVYGDGLLERIPREFEAAERLVSASLRIV